MTAFQLTAAETSLARCTALARICQDVAGQEVRAEALRCLMLGLAVIYDGETEARISEVKGPGLRLKDALITGPLDLADARAANGEAAPPLVLLNCTIPDKMDLARARLRHLSLKGSRFTHLYGPDLVLDGPLDISGVGTSQIGSKKTGWGGEGLCWIEVEGARIGGGVEAGESRFAGPQGGKDDFLNQAPFALNFRFAQIGGVLSMEPNFYCAGGIRLNYAVIGGSLWASGAKLETTAFGDAPSTSFFGEGLRVDGALLLDSAEGKRFTSSGMVNLENAKIGRDLDLIGADLQGGINAAQIDIGGTAKLSSSAEMPFYALGLVRFSGGKIGGDLDLTGADLKGVFRASNLEVGGSALLCASETRAFTAGDRVNLFGAKIAKNLEMAGANLIGPLEANNIEVGGNVLLCETDVEKFQPVIPFVIQSDISLIGAKINRNLDLKGARLGVDGRRPMHSKKQMKTGKPPQQPDGLRQKFTLIGINVSGDLDLRNTRIDGDFRLNIANISGRVFVELVKDKIAKGKSVSKYNFSLQDAKVGLLIDKTGQGFDKNSHLILDGFSYARLTESKHTKGHEKKIRENTEKFKNLGKLRLEWLNLQYETSTPTFIEFSPDPYDRLINFFRQEGFYTDARQIASARMTLERKLQVFCLWRPFVWLYWGLFEYGLSPFRAILTFIICIMIGWAGAEVADGKLNLNPWLSGKPALYSETPQYIPLYEPILVIHRHSQNTLLFENTKAKNAFIPGMMRSGIKIDPNKDAELAIPCGNEIDPLLLAIDTFVPLLDLGQSDRCTISTKPSATGWRIASAIYASLGAIITALTVLTVSGVLRRQAEDVSF